MALPVVLGLPWLASIISGFFLSIAGFIAARLTLRVGSVLVWSGISVAMLVALAALFSQILDSIYYAMPSSLAQSFYLFIPSNTGLCISAYLTARVAFWIYRQKVRLAQGVLDAGGASGLGKR